MLLEAAGIPVQEAYDRSGGLTPAQHAAASRRGIEILNSFGVTAFQDAGVSVEILGALADLDRADEADAWVVSSLLINDEIFGFDPIGEPLLDRGEEFRTAHHRPDFVKIFLDGVPPARTASFLEPYLPDAAHGAHFHGETTMTLDELTGWLRSVARRGLGAKVHCTGDGSARLVLDATERVRREASPPPFRSRTVSSWRSRTSPGWRPSTSRPTSLRSSGIRASSPRLWPRCSANARSTPSRTGR